MKTDWLRLSLIGGMVAVFILLFFRWNAFQERKAELATVSSTEEIVRSSQTQTSATLESTTTKPENKELQEPADDFPQIPVDAADEEPVTQLDSEFKNELIEVTTNTFKLIIDPIGGDILKVSLLKHFEKLNQTDRPLVLLNNTQSLTYIAKSGLAGKNGIDGPTGRAKFTSPQTQYQLQEGQDTLVVDLLNNNDSLDVIKRFTFERDSYLIKIEYIIKNNSEENQSVRFVGSIKRDSSNPNIAPPLAMQPFLGGATTTEESRYEKFSFDDIEDETFSHKIKGGWLAMVQHYFLSAWIPPENLINHYQFRKLKSGDFYSLEFTSAPVNIAPSSSQTLSSSFYTGPREIRRLEKASPYLDLTVDYSWLWWIAKPLFYGLDFMHSFANNWGIAIILLTIVIKAIFFYPSALSYKSMARMRKLQPKMQELKDRYGSDKQRMSSELMKLYKTEKINPVSGCLPILIQMPVFIALYWVLMESVELRHAPFFFWIEDLSVKDPIFILPLIMGASMWVQQKFNPTPTDPMQAKILQLMPIFFTGLCLFMPAGLVLYWVVNNGLTIAQQYFITKKIDQS